jgi:hypothetical protein
MATPFEAAASEAAGGAVSFEFKGQTFKAQDPGGMALIEWAAAGDLDTSSTSPAEVVAANTAIYEVLRALVVDEDWRRFRRLALDTRASGDELLVIIGDVMAKIAGRPTEPPSVSLTEHETNGRPSTDGPGSRATRSRSSA